MDSRIGIGDKLDIEKIETRLSANPDKREVVYSSQVMDESEQGELLVSMPIHEGKVIPFSVGQEFFATFYTKHGLLRCRAAVIGRYKRGTLYLMEIMQKSILQKVQRREYFRFDCRVPMNYRVLPQETVALIKSGEVVDLDKLQLEWKNGVMLDLSGGGVRFVSATQETKESMMQVRFEIAPDEIPETIYVYATLLRSEKNQNNSAIFDNRLMFWKIDKGLREKIIRYIFDEQRKKRSKQLGLD